MIPLLNKCRRMVQLALMAMVVAPALAAAHESSIVEVTIDIPTRHLAVEMDLVDADFVLGLSGANGAKLTVGDVLRSSTVLQRYVLQNISIDACRLTSDRLAPGIRNGSTPRVVIGFDLSCDALPETIEVSSSVFRELPDYRTVLVLRSNTFERLAVIDQGTIAVSTGDRGQLSALLSFTVDGIHHILAGFDHLLFLLLLVLPVWQRDSAKSRFLAMAGIVTAFSIAHSITLSLSALGYMSLPSGPVELMIAASILLVALMNLAGKVEALAWPLAYVFGLIHGFGFAGAFAELASGETIRWTNLLAFNVGVELGQLAVIAGLLLLLQAISAVRGVRRFVVPAGSGIAGIVAAVWMFERL